MMMRKLAIATVALMFSSGLAMAEVSTEALVSDLQSQGFDWIEVKRGPTQIKVEAVRDGVKYDVVYDRETGAVIKSETESAGDDAGRSGVEVRDRDRDFVSEGSASSDDDDSDGKGRGRGRGGDDDDDDDRDRGRGHDDDDDRNDDHGDDHGSDRNHDSDDDHGGDRDDDRDDDHDDDRDDD